MKELEDAMSDPYSRIPDGSKRCLHCNRYRSSMMERSERCTCCGGTGLVAVADAAEQKPNGHEPRRLGHAR
jgi:hypothetical protein